MDIHPHPPAHSFKDLLVQLFTITLGVLIALGLEGLVEWQHHRSLVREAREMIDREIEDNRKDLGGELALMSKRKQDLGQAFQLADELLTTKQSQIHEFSLGMQLASLDDASWRTAERTSALSYMSARSAIPTKRRPKISKPFARTCLPPLASSLWKSSLEPSC